MSRADLVSGSTIFVYEVGNYARKTTVLFRISATAVVKYTRDTLEGSPTHPRTGMVAIEAAKISLLVAISVMVEVEVLKTGSEVKNRDKNRQH